MTGAPTTQLSSDEVSRIARLSRLELTSVQVESCRAQLSAILGYMEVLRKLDLSGVEPLTHVSELHNRMDPDIPGEALPNRALMEMAPESAPPFVKIPKVLGDSGGGA